MLLCTFAVPPFGMQIGGAESLAVALPPWVAVANAKPLTVEQVALAVAPCFADATAEQSAVDSAVAVLPTLAVASATPAPPEAVEVDVLPPVASQPAVPDPSPSPPPVLPLPAV